MKTTRHTYTVGELERVKGRLIEIAKRPSSLGEDVDLMIAVRVIDKEISQNKERKQTVAEMDLNHLSIRRAELSKEFERETGDKCMVYLDGVGDVCSESYVDWLEALIVRQEVKLAALESSLSRAQERLKEIEKIADGARLHRHISTCDCCYCRIYRLATEDAKPSPEREEKPTVKPEKE